MIFARQTVRHLLHAAYSSCTGSATAVRRSEGLMEVEVTYVRADEGRIGPAYLRVHVRAVHIDVTAVRVNRIDHLPDSLLENAVGRWVRDHTAGEVVFVLLGFGFPVVQISVTLLVASDYAGNETSLHAGGRVGAVRRSRDEKDVSMALSLTAEVLTDDYQTGIFAGSAGGRLEGTSVKAGDGAELLFEFLHDRLVTDDLIFRREGMDIHCLRERDRYHRCRWVEFHRTRAQRNHRCREGYILAVEALEIAHEFGLGVVFPEDLRLHVVDVAYAALVDGPETFEGFVAVL